VTAWLEDDPYPLGMVEEYTDPAEAVDDAKMSTVIACLRRTRGLLSETQESPALPAEVTFDDDPAIASWQLCAEAPLSVYDAQRLLTVEGTNARLDLLLELTEELEQDLHRMLAEQ